ncbi:MAG: single-strand DNA-binding protein [Baekduia sp.]|jgi:single-strand DNA-binding protein|nr:single-strand DNA-binding protein [Baekduia sp.]
MNNVSIIGRLVADPELSETKDGTPVCKARLAVDGGGRNIEAGYFNVVQYGNGGKAAAETLTQGWLVAVSGRLEHRSWQDKESEKWREAIDIVGQIQFLAAPRAKDDQAAEPGEPVAAGARSDDDIPF